MEKMTVAELAWLRHQFEAWSHTQDNMYFTDSFYGCQNNHLYKIGIMMDSLDELDKLPMMGIPREISENILGECVDLDKLAQHELDEKRFYKDFK